MTPHVPVPLADSQHALAQHAPEVRLCTPCSPSCRLARTLSSRQDHHRVGQCDELTAVLASNTAAMAQRPLHTPLRMTHPAGIRG